MSQLHVNEFHSCMQLPPFWHVISRHSLGDPWQSKISINGTSGCEICSSSTDLHSTSRSMDRKVNEIYIEFLWTGLLKMAMPIFFFAYWIRFIEAIWKSSHFPTERILFDWISRFFIDFFAIMNVDLHLVYTHLALLMKKAKNSVSSVWLNDSHYRYISTQNITWNA